MVNGWSRAFRKIFIIFCIILRGEILKMGKTTESGRVADDRLNGTRTLSIS